MTPPPSQSSAITTTTMSSLLLDASPEVTVKTNHVTNRLVFDADHYYDLYVAVQYNDDSNNDNDDDDVSVLTMESKEEEYSDDDDDDNCSLGGHLTPSSHHACHHHYHHHHHQVTNISLHEIRRHDKIDCRFSSSDDRLHDSKNTLSTFCSSNATASNKSMSAPIKPQRTRSPSPQPSPLLLHGVVRGHELSNSCRKTPKHPSLWGTCSEHPMSQNKSTSLQTRSSHLPPNKPLRYQSRIYENHFWESDDDDDESGTSFHDDYIDPFLKPVIKESEIVTNKVRSNQPSPAATECQKTNHITLHWDMHEAFVKVASDRSMVDDLANISTKVTPPKQPQRRITSCDF